jgi:hypothetical protein
MARRIEAHPIVLQAQQSIATAKKTVHQCELDLGTAERALKRGFEGQVDAYATGKDVKNPGGKRRKPPTLSTLQGHVTDAQMKLIAAQQVQRKAEADLVAAKLKAREAVLDDYRQQFTKAVQALNADLNRAAKRNEKVIQIYEDAQADLGNPQLPNLAWRELQGEKKLAASRLATWQRSLEQFLDS